MFIHVQFYEYEINDHLTSFPVLICFLWNVADRIPVMAADGIVINRIERPEDSEGQRKQMFFSSIDVLMRGIISGELWVLTQCFILLLDQWFWHTNLIKFGWGWNPPFSRSIFCWSESLQGNGYPNEYHQGHGKDEGKGWRVNCWRLYMFYFYFCTKPNTSQGDFQVYPSFDLIWCL